MIQFILLQLNDSAYELHGLNLRIILYLCMTMCTVYSQSMTTVLENRVELDVSCSIRRCVTPYGRNYLGLMISSALIQLFKVFSGGNIACNCTNSVE